MSDTSKSYYATINLTIGQIRVLHLALEKYIRSHDIILHNDKFDMNEMKLLFEDRSWYCKLCSSLNNILREHDSQQYKETDNEHLL